MDNSPPTTHRISQFQKWEREGCLELSATFQRNPVWSDKNRSYLIDTILNQYPVPEIYLQVNTDKDGNTKYIVVDGQQRVRAILAFIEGEYSLLETESPSWGGKEFKNLPDGVKKDFWDYPIVTRELKTNKEDEIRDVFKRLNKYVVPLNAQELRNATFRGKFITLMDNLAENDFLAENKIVSPNEIRRMKDIEFLSELFVAMMDGAQGDTREVLDKYYKLYDVDFQHQQDFQDQFIKVRNFTTDIMGSLKGTGWNSKSDYYALFVTFSEILKNHHLPDDYFESVKNNLLEFRQRVNVEKEQSKDKDVLQYYKSVQTSTGKKDQRLIRINIVRHLILPFFVPKDSKRVFTEEQRQFAWDLSKDKLCAVCGKVVEYADYDLDHKVPHSKGGKTTVENSQITHKKCNQSKSNK